jgi:hypothetical protein
MTKPRRDTPGGFAGDVSKPLELAEPLVPTDVPTGWLVLSKSCL